MTGLDEWRAFYASLGFATIPLRARDKRPLRSGWQREGAWQWEGAPPDANVGILTGAPSGDLVVLDFDTEDGPRELLGMHPREIGVHTLVVKTARGWHVYARDGSARTTSPVPGLDVRAGGSMVVAPPSIHPSGTTYQLTSTARSVANLSLFALPATPNADTKTESSVEPIVWEDVEALIAMQSPKLRASWSALKLGGGDDFDRSRADYAIARCLWEGGYSTEDVARVLLELPGSKAKERGRSYAFRTAVRVSSPVNVNASMRHSQSAHGYSRVREKERYTSDKQ